MNINNFLWVTPFSSFIIGYLVMHHIMHIPESNVPHLVGKQVHSILPIITQHNLNIRLLEQKEEIDLPAGIILNQTPAAGTTIKQNQPIFIVTSKKPLVNLAPPCIGQSIDEICARLQSQGIYPRIYYVPHIYPTQHCFAQSPQHNKPLENNKIILYVSSGNNKPIIWPDFINIPLHDVIDFLDYYHIKPYIVNSEEIHTHTNLIVIEQRPFAGTLLTLDENKPLSVHLRISTRR